jgi:hypothetical protein
VKWNRENRNNFTRKIKQRPILLFPSTLLILTSMHPAEICDIRLATQRLTGAPFPSPAAAVRHLGALQSQDYAGAKWALSRRSAGTPSDAALDALFDAGKILRTHLMRTTWHFVDPVDARWMLDLLAPRGRQAMSFMNRKEGLTPADFTRSKKILEKALRDKQYKTRNELAEVLKKNGVEPGAGIRLAHLMMDAELEGLVTSGPRLGKQFSYALLEERAPKAKGLQRDEALAELTRRYFSGHGPAQAADFAWWSGLTLTEVKKGLDSVKGELEEIEHAGKTWWMGIDGGIPGICRETGVGRRERNTSETQNAKEEAAEEHRKKPEVTPPRIHLLPNYDEYFIAYKDRSAIGLRAKAAKTPPDPKLFFAHILFIEGQIAGGWQRLLEKKSAALEIGLVGNLSRAEQAAVKAEAERFGRFLGMGVSVAYKP